MYPSSNVKMADAKTAKNSNQHVIIPEYTEISYFFYFLFFFFMQSLLRRHSDLLAHDCCLASRQGLI